MARSAVEFAPAKTVCGRTGLVHPPEIRPGLLPGRQAVNRAVFDENSLLSMTIRLLNGPEWPCFGAFLWIRTSAERAGP
jgi:hypothetical protein